jgi:hypothetical protein
MEAVAMDNVPSLAVRLAPNTVRQLEQAAEKRSEEAECLKKQNRFLAALYLYGYSVEMCLAAAYFRSAGFSSCEAISDDERKDRMRRANRELHSRDGKPLMSKEPHPLVGWARFLEWQRGLSGSLKPKEVNRLREAVQKARQVYRHWRPELRYKLTNVSMDQLDEVRQCVHWFIKQRGQL